MLGRNLAVVTKDSVETTFNSHLLEEVVMIKLSLFSNAGAGPIARNPSATYANLQAFKVLLSLIKIEN